jgi:hypothetical protein
MIRYCTNKEGMSMEDKSPMFLDEEGQWRV